MKIDEKRVEKLALKLQSLGPDEFPFGYYLFLAREQLYPPPERPDQ
jgi:hypothetical protein